MKRRSEATEGERMFADVPEGRRRNMKAVRGKNTRPEMTVRRLLHAMGYRYRLHGEGLAGRPDIVFPARRCVVFVHGCFWHQHPDPVCRNAVLPRTRREFWSEKLAANVARDQLVLEKLADAGWRALVVWECELRDSGDMASKLRAYLGPPSIAPRPVPASDIATRLA